MRREKALFILFLLWGGIILFAGFWLITNKKAALMRFSRRIAEKNITVYPTRATIYDRNGEKIAWSQWQFYIQTVPRRRKMLENFFRILNIEFVPVRLNTPPRLHHDIPDEKAAEAVKLAEKFNFRIRRRIVRKTIALSPAGRQFIGDVLLNYGLYGAEKKYDAVLRGFPGHYRIMQGPSGKIDKNSFRVMLPMQPGKAIKLPLSAAELQYLSFIPELH